MNRAPIFPLVLGLVATVAHGQQSARIVKYHANDIVSVRARMRYTTLIQLPVTEKILEVATGDKDFWIIDAIGNYCFLHPAKEGIHSNLNLITDKGTVYSFTLDDVETVEPDLKVVIEPSDPSSLAATNGAPKKPVAKAAPKKSAANGVPKGRFVLQPLEPGQIWRMAELNLQVGLVGKLLVHYKLAKPDAVRIANSVGGRATVEKYLKTNKAILIGIDKAAAAKARL